MISCEPDDAMLVGKWTIKDYDNSSGDDKYRTRKATSEWTLEFFEDGTVQSSRQLCPDSPTYNGTYNGDDLLGNGCAAIYSYNLEDSTSSSPAKTASKHAAHVL